MTASCQLASPPGRSAPERGRHGASPLGPGTRLASARAQKHRQATGTGAAAIPSRSESLAWQPGQRAPPSRRFGRAPPRRPVAGRDEGATPRPGDAALALAPCVRRGHQVLTDQGGSLGRSAVSVLLQPARPPQRMEGSRRYPGAPSSHFLIPLQRGEVKGGGHTAHADDPLALLILQRESSWCFLYAIKSNVD